MTLFLLSDLESKRNFKLSHRHRATRDLRFSNGELANITCQGELSCLGKCRSERDPGPINEDIKCFCDEHCMVFRDCCADYEQVCLSVVNQRSSRSLNAELWQCNNDIDGVRDAKGVWMISACPANWTQDDIAGKCNGNMQHMSGNCQDFAPVTDMSGTTYKNRFCALCHGVQANTSQLYDVQNAKTTSGSFVMNCSLVKWKPRSRVPRRYCLEVTRNESCFNKSSMFEEYNGCLSRPPGVVKDTKTNSKLYFNRFCALCAGVALANIACGPTKTPAFSLPTLNNHSSPTTSTPPTGLVPISIFLNPEEDQRIQVCQAGHVLDPVSKNCRKALRKAEPSIPFLNRYTTTIQFTSRLGCADTNYSNITIREGLEFALERCSLEVYNTEVRYVDCLIYSAHVTVAFQETNVKQTIPSLINCNLTIRNSPFLITKGRWEPMLCAKIDIFKLGEYSLIADADSALYINRTGEIIHKRDYWSNQTGTNSTSGAPVGDVRVCRKTLMLKCSGELIHLEENDYVILLNGSLYRNGSNTIHDFTTIDGKVAICISLSTHRTEVAVIVISYVGIGLSIVCLLLVLITYSLFKELRTLPGVNLMNLCLSLLAVHSMFMVAGATRIRLPCRSIAVLLHYFNLSSFVWMSLIAFDTYRTFSRTCYTRQSTGKVKARFLAIGWLPSLVFVVVCFSLDQSGLVAIGYGGRNHCWINNAKSNMFVFVIPVAFSILFNALLFFLTVNSIRNIRKQTQQVGKVANSRRNLVLFVKLAVLMGFTWIFGYLKILVSNYFDYPFVIFTSFQGVYIAFGFVFTARVKMMYQNLLSVTTTTSSSTSSCETRF